MRVALLTSWSSATQSGIVQTFVRPSKNSQLSVTSLCQHGTARSCQCTGSVWKPLTGVLTSELPANVIASQLLIRHLIRKFQLVYLNLLDLLDNHLDVLHDHLLGMEISIDFCNLLMTPSSGDFSTSFSSTPWTSCVWPNPCSFQPAVTLSQLELICHLRQLGNTSFSIFLTRIGFLDSQILLSPLLEQFNHNLPAVGTALSFMGRRK